MTITLSRTPRAWFATFDGSTIIPYNVILPLPWTSTAPRATVVADLTKRFPLATFK